MTLPTREPDEARRPGTEQELRSLIERTPVMGTVAEMRAAFTRLVGPQPKLTEIDRGGIRCLAVGAGPEIV